MDKFIFALAGDVEHGKQCELMTFLLEKGPWIVVGHDDFLVSIALLVAHAVGAGGVEDVEVLIQFQNFGGIVVADHNVAHGFLDGIVQPFVILFCKHHGIKPLGFKVGRVTVDESIFSVILLNKCFKVLVFNGYLRKGS